jgi:tRNA pseudouridine(38-40) synthase
MKTFRFTVAYDGTKYFGWQSQKKQPTVQDTLEAAIEQVTGRKARLLSSGRTDAGVHALGQVASFQADTRLDVGELQNALNAVLPADIAVRHVRQSDAGFHPTRHALRKRYRYLIYNGPVRDVFYRHYCWHYNLARLDAYAMHRAAQALLGKHDFSSFQSAGSMRKTRVRTIFDICVQTAARDKEPETRNLQGLGQGGEFQEASRAVPGISEASRAVPGISEASRAVPGISEASRAVPGPGSIEASRAVPGPGSLVAEAERRKAERAGGGGGDNQSRAVSARSGDFGFFLPASSTEDWITIEVEADGFLYNMVRTIVGTLVEVGRGTQPESWVADVLESKDRHRAGPNAPPQGLFLVRVDYLEK